MGTGDGSTPQAPVVLFGYDSSPFTTKVKLALKLKQIPYTFVVVPSMMPRPILKDNFNVTYRKIPVLAIGREIYIDTSLILEVLESQFPPANGYGTLYPSSAASFRPLLRGFASYWTDRPFFRVTTGLIPASVWRTHFGTDRSNLIGHKLDAEKLARKVPENLSGLDLQLSLLEPLLSGDQTKSWLFGTDLPSVADLALWYQLDWGEKISRGEGIDNLTGGGTSDGDGEGMGAVFNKDRYPGLFSWFERFKTYVKGLPSVESKLEKENTQGVEQMLQQLKQTPLLDPVPLLATPAPPHRDLDGRNGLAVGAEVTIAPDDTGRDSPTIGTIVALTPEEVVITPQKTSEGTGPAVGEVRIHFPRVGFVIRPHGQSKL
ncbi:hypothetical protein AYO21_09098 [Fonsecaea monophora]|uniref:GST N-terminal domain-containing protein n=1 Tax=Fonsecaea monophora TaxID=254056 RepID=A0A177EXB7_9EURO|nr:hypothetical protein AYO21_09098 [Fonsecaea monophora]KAH0827251.1 hypothetical protein FOPE_00040 [Fonsecaea pedrosoi]OAG36714.1 hypothetical protein AYO21_09098 [Fonsecaea monophora]